MWWVEKRYSDMTPDERRLSAYLLHKYGPAGPPGSARGTVPGLSRSRPPAKAPVDDRRKVLLVPGRAPSRLIGLTVDRATAASLVRDGVAVYAEPESKVATGQRKVYLVQGRVLRRALEVSIPRDVAAMLTQEGIAVYSTPE